MKAFSRKAFPTLTLKVFRISIKLFLLFYLLKNKLALFTLLGGKDSEMKTTALLLVHLGKLASSQGSLSQKNKLTCHILKNLSSSTSHQVFEVHVSLSPFPPLLPSFLSFPSSFCLLSFFFSFTSFFFLPSLPPCPLLPSHAPFLPSFLLSFLPAV